MRVGCNEVDISQCKLCGNHDLLEDGILDVCGLNGIFCVDVEKNECEFMRKNE